VGNGSGLTGIVAGSSDRIVSGSVNMIAEQTSGTVRRHAGPEQYRQRGLRRGPLLYVPCQPRNPAAGNVPAVKWLVFTAAYWYARDYRNRRSVT